MGHRIEEMEFDKTKIYCVYIGSVSYTAKFIKTVRIDNTIFFVFKEMVEGFGFHKNLYIQARYVGYIFEFDSMDEYNKHYKLWEEEQQEKKFKSDI